MKCHKKIRQQKIKNLKMARLQTSVEKKNEFRINRGISQNFEKSVCRCIIMTYNFGETFHCDSDVSFTKA